MSDVLRTVSTRATLQTQPVGQATVPNAAGGYGFAVDDMVRLHRFAVLGVDGGTYYDRETKLARENAEVVTRLAKSDPVALVDAIVAISKAGRAPKVQPAIFALALCAAEADEAGRRYALAALPQVCRTGTHMYLFAGYVEQFRGWGRGLKRAVGDWYNGRQLDKLTYQLLKYRQREGWRHADLLALSHPDPGEQIRTNMYRYVVDTMSGYRNAADITRITSQRRGADYTVPDWSPDRVGVLPDLVGAYEQVQDASPKDAAAMVGMYDLSWEMLPDRLMNEPVVWEAMLSRGVPPTALIKQLPRLTNLGLTTGDTGAAIVAQLTDPEALKRGRVHPITLLVAARTYASGRSVQGRSTWPPTPNIIDALHDGFYLSYGGVEPSGKRLLLASDVSQSMTVYSAGGQPLKALEVAGALALVMANTEKDVVQLGFTTQASPLTISKRQRLDDVLEYMRRQPNGGTDCSLPMRWAIHTHTYVDAFVLVTDEETWAGPMHAFQALQLYRQQINKDAKMVVAALTPKGYSTADPNDAGSLSVVGFDTNVPQMITDFCAGRI